MAISLKYNLKTYIIMYEKESNFSCYFSKLFGNEIVFPISVQPIVSWVKIDVQSI